MNCAQCNAELAEGVQFCSACGAPVTVASPAPPLAQMPVQPPSASGAAMPALKTVTSLYIAYLVCNGLLIVSAFLTWEHLKVAGIEVASANGFGATRGWFVFLAAWVAAGFVVASMFRVEPVRGMRIAQFVCAAIAIGMALIEFSITGSEASCTDSEFLQICEEHTAGVGAVTAMLGGIALGVAALFRGLPAFMRSRAPAARE